MSKLAWEEYSFQNIFRNNAMGIYEREAGEENA